MRPLTQLTVSLVLLTAGLAACVPQDAGSLKVRILGNVVAQRDSTGINACFPEEVTVFRTQGVLDLATGHSYIYYLAVQNLLPTTSLVTGADPSHLRMDMNTVTLNKAVMRLTSPATGTPLAGKFQNKSLATDWTVPLNLVVEPSEDAIGPFMIVPDVIGKNWQARFADPGMYKGSIASFTRYNYTTDVTIRVHLEGEMPDGTIVSSAAVDYPIQLCWGCLLYPPSMAPQPEPDAQWQVCSTMAVSEDFIYPCHAGQDEYLECTAYCQQCTLDMSTASGTCDDKFCPPLQ